MSRLRKQLLGLFGPDGGADERYQLSLDGVAFLENQLKQLKSKVHEVQFEQLKARALLPVDESVDPGAETIAHEILGRVGEAKLLANGADDIPFVDIEATESSTPVVTLGAGYRHTIVDMWRAGYANRPLKNNKAVAAKRAIETKLDAIGATGIPGATGLINNASVPTLTAAHTTWIASSKTATEILDTMHKAVQDVVDATSEIYVPDTFIMPPSQFGHVATKTFTTGTPMTVLEAFLRQSPYIKNVGSWSRLKTAGAGSTTRALIYKRDPEVLEWDIPLDFWQSPVQVQGIESRVFCLARASGVTFYHPKAAGYLDNI